MFIKPSKFEKLIKTAYRNSRLHIGHDGVNFLAAGAGWYMAMVEDLMPKELRAVVVKYVGRMPKKNEYFLALSDGDQEEVPGAFCKRWSDTKKFSYAEATRLAYVVGSNMFNIFQSVDENYTFMIYAPLVGLIDESMIDEADGELGISGPYISRVDNQMIVENDRMQLRLFIEIPDTKADDLLKYLRDTDLNGLGEDEEEA